MPGGFVRRFQASRLRRTFCSVTGQHRLYLPGRDWRDKAQMARVMKTLLGSSMYVAKGGHSVKPNAV